MTLLLTQGMQSESCMGVECGEDVLELSRDGSQGYNDFQPPCDCCQNAFLFSKVFCPLLFCFAVLGDCSSGFARDQNLLFKGNASVCFGG